MSPIFALSLPHSSSLVSLGKDLLSLPKALCGCHEEASLDHLWPVGFMLMGPTGLQSTQKVLNWLPASGHNKGLESKVPSLTKKKAY